MPTSKKPKAAKAESKTDAVKPRAKASASSARAPTPTTPELSAKANTAAASNVVEQPHAPGDSAKATEAAAPKRASRSKAKTATAAAPAESTGGAVLAAPGVSASVEGHPPMATGHDTPLATAPTTEPAAIATAGASAAAAPDVAATKTTRSRRKTAVAAEPAAPAGPAAPAYDLATREPAADAAHLPRDIAALLSIGREVLGIKNFRAGQVEAYTELLAGHDVLAVMPTGSGKSLLYQLPSLILPGLTVVVSPLIALIKDQIDKMVAKGVAAVRIDSTLTVKQRREVDALVQSPGGKLLLTTPERMADPEFRAFLRTAAGNVGVSRFVVDEAHCVSQWGHDFRPAYLSMRKALEDVGRPPVLATTATAPPHVREDILFQLGIADAKTVTTTFDRPNLHYEVIVFHDEDEKLRTLVTLLKKLPRPGIVYCATVKKVEDLHESLGRWGIPVARYHGRMTKNERDAEQQRFMDSKDIVMVATNAFGLGIDKQDIRNVLHYHVPGSLEAYAQEAGRGGRDGKPARCVLLFSPDDVAIQEYFLSGSYPTRRQVRAVYDTLEAFGALRGSQADDTQPTIANISLSAGVGSQRTRTVLSLLKDEKFIVERDGGMFYIADPAPSQEQLTERARQYEARRIADRRRLDALLAYVKAPGCRNQVILDYLGEADAPACGRCDNCLRSKEARLAASSEAASLGATVMRRLDDDGAVVEPVKKVVRARTIRIDAPPADGSTNATVPGGTPPAAKSGPVVVRRQANVATAPGPHAAPPPNATGPTVLRRPPAAQADSGADRTGARGQAHGPAMVRRAAQANTSITGGRGAHPGSPGPQGAPSGRGGRDDHGAQDERTAAPLTRIAPLAAPAGPLPSSQAAVAPNTTRPAGEPPDEFEDDDENDDDLDDDDLDDEDDDDLDDEDDDLDDEDDDDLDDEDDDDLDDEDDDDLDDDEDDDDDYELIEKTAAELAEEGIEGTGEVTVLARKRVPKAPKQRVRPDYTNPKDAEAAAEARRRRRRRRRKRRAMLPPKSAFSTPVLVAGELRGKHGSGPVIEYVRSPLRVGPSPVASANPNDAGALRAGRRKKRSRWERRVDQERQQSPNANTGAPNAERRRRRRRRRRPGLEGNNPPMLGAPQAHAAQGAPGNFAGDDGGPRKRRRRRRRGRGGRNRWQGGPGAPGGDSNNGQGGASSGGSGPAS